ncbi:hypothetical protein Tsubulata_010912 [Turnera subulata]|uniref:DUF7653 domain-containing protein n=1 Tax=Turnera subulata TaxID=218843 RepID=A0A9Q0F459_9ROSI|nr:hypothetical protein Tsubulata_010912 [Turnera subulata]
MKKFFSFKSSSSSPPSKDKQVWEVPFEHGLNNRVCDKAEKDFRSPRGFFSKFQKQASESQSSNLSAGLRRSRSYSSAAFLAEGLEKKILSSTGDQNRSPSSGTSRSQCNHSSQRAVTPERKSKPKQIDVSAVQNANALERPSSSHSHPDFSGNSSVSNASTKVLDRYIDGEQQQERSKSRNSSRRNYSATGQSGGRLPPRVQNTAPTSPTDSVKDKPRSQSFRDAKGTRLQFSSRDWVENGFGHESPRRLAKNVIERLSQTYVLPKSNSKEFEHDIPITLEDIYGEPDSRYFDSKMDGHAPKSHSSQELYDNIDSYDGCDFSSFQKQNFYHEGNAGFLNNVQIGDASDLELQQRSKEAEERVLHLSEELDQQTFLQLTGFDVPSLIQCIKKLMEDKISLAIEVSGLLKSQINERDFAKEELRAAKAELESQTRRLEKEKNELQSALEKELDRRSTDWSLKLDKYQVEEQRLRDRVRELAEQNVSLQREVSSFNERETESKNVIKHSNEQLSHLTKRVEELDEENQDLKEKLSELQEKFSAAEEALDCVKRNFEEKDEDCKELQKSIVRLLRTCSDQEKTIEGLREGFKEQALEKPDKRVAKLQMEQMRLTGVELALRREVESQRLESDSLRHENINLLNRMKGNAKEIGALYFKLDKELWTRTCYLENQGISMLQDSNQLCSKLLEYIKGKLGQLQENKHGIDGQFILESDVKVKGFRRGTESLTRSLHMASSLLQEKANSISSISHSPCTNTDGSGKLNHLKSEESLRLELKEEILLTRLLREKLYSKELEVEQLQAELAAAVRGNDILRCELQNAQDNLSCANHKLKDFELQMLKKDETMSRFQNSLEESTKELTIIRGMLPKVSQERDLMWEEVKQYNEKNMLLNSEVNMLKKKIDALDEDILLKEGQITILKDALGKRPFDILGSPDSTREFLLQ